MSAFVTALQLLGDVFRAAAAGAERQALREAIRREHVAASEARMRKALG